MGVKFCCVALQETTWTDDAGGRGAEGNIWTQGRGDNKRREKIS